MALNFFEEYYKWKNITNNMEIWSALMIIAFDIEKHKCIHKTTLLKPRLLQYLKMYTTPNK